MIDLLFFIFQTFSKVLLGLWVVAVVWGILRKLSKDGEVFNGSEESVVYLYILLMLCCFLTLMHSVAHSGNYTNAYMCSGVGVFNELKVVGVVEKNKHQAVKNQEVKTKEEKLWEFARKEMPRVQRTYVEIGEALRIQRERIAKLRMTLERFSRTPYDEDSDYRQLESKCQEMEVLQKSIIENIRETYIAAVKYEVSMGKSQERSLHQQAYEDGIREAELAIRRFEEMKRHK